MLSFLNILDRPYLSLSYAGIAAHSVPGIKSQQALSQAEIGDDEVLKLLLRSTASRPAKGAAVARVGTMFRASASHLEFVGVSQGRFDSGCVECWLCF